MLFSRFIHTWQSGRQLKQASKTGRTVQFKYDHNGLRTQKIVTEGSVNTTTDYILHGKQVMHMTRTSGNDVDEMHFFYDAQGRPAKVRFNSTMYTYIHNLQGDIALILDGGRNSVVDYKYDAWGKPLSVTGSMAETLGALNPFRYRGYVYDTETGLYYLSRYLKNDIGRFINTDILIDINNTILSYNLFCYEKNNACTCLDIDGLEPAECLYIFFTIPRIIPYKQNMQHLVKHISMGRVLCWYPSCIILAFMRLETHSTYIWNDSKLLCGLKTPTITTFSGFCSRL